MARDIDVEITIGGIGLLWITEPLRTTPGLRGPSEARKLVVLFPPEGKDGNGQHEGHAGHGPRPPRHRPRLTFFAEDNLLLTPGESLLESPDGREVVSLDLTNRRVFFEPPYPYYRDHPISTLRWATPDESGTLPDVPARPADDRNLDWLLNADDIGLTDPDPALATTVIHLPEGHVFARNVFRNRHADDVAPAMWSVGERTQAVARETVVRLEGLWQRLRICITPKSDDVNADRNTVEREIQLLPSHPGLVRVAVSYLPDEFIGDDSHLGLLRELQPGCEISFPVQQDYVETAVTACENCCKIAGGFEALRFSEGLPFGGELPTYFSMIGADRAWKRGMGVEEVRIAVLDTGIDTREGARFYLKGKIAGAWPRGRDGGGRPWMDRFGHGTMMACIIAGRYREGDPVHGIAPGCQLLNFRVVDAQGQMTSEEPLVQALNELSTWSTNPDLRARVALLSVRIAGPGGVSDDLLRAIGALEDVLVVVAAGETPGANPDPRLADLGHVLVVGVVDDAGATYTSNGDAASVHLAAPGTGIRTVNRYGGAITNGSSAAAAMVAGAAALAFSANPNASAAEIRQLILESVRWSDGLANHVSTSGVLDIAAMLSI